MLLHFMTLSLLSVGGAVTTAPDMHRYLVGERHWLTDAQFSSGLALAQAAPGPNVLFVGLLGWNVGLNHGKLRHGPARPDVITLGGMLLPSSLLMYMTASWGHRNRDMRAVRAFKQGMAPIVVGLMVATAWLLSSAHTDPVRDATPVGPDRACRLAGLAHPHPPALAPRSGALLWVHSGWV
jgi:chromate transporter